MTSARSCSGRPARVVRCIGGRVSKQSDPRDWLRFATTTSPRPGCCRPMQEGRLVWRASTEQAAEKALKASLVHAAIQFRKTHDRVVLVALQPEPVRSEVGDLDLQQLQQWAVDARYPADLPDITAGEAARVVAIAEQIVAAVGAALRTNGPV